MRLLPSLANLNNVCRKAAAPNNGTAAFFYSTKISLFRHIMSLFEKSLFAGSALKKAMQVIGRGLPVMAKNVEKQKFSSIFLMIAVAPQSL